MQPLNREYYQAVIRRVGGLEVFEFLARRGSLVIRRVGGLEVRVRLHIHDGQVIRRVGGLEVHH